MRRILLLGGLFAASVAAQSAGFWRTMRDVDGRWWMVTPDGRKTMLLGADHVRHMGWWCEATGRKDYEAANLRKYGTREAWETNTLARLKAWGFNLLGVGSDPPLRHRGLAYTEILHLGDGFTHDGNDPTRAICPNPINRQETRVIQELCFIHKSKFFPVVFFIGLFSSFSTSPPYL
jgi:hypothetical protein